MGIKNFKKDDIRGEDRYGDKKIEKKKISGETAGMGIKKWKTKPKKLVFYNLLSKNEFRDYLTDFVDI